MTFSGFTGCALRTLIYDLSSLLNRKAPHDCVQYVLFARHMKNTCRKSLKKLRPSGRKLASSPSWKVHWAIFKGWLDTQLFHFFLDMHGDLYLFQFLYRQFNAMYFLTYWFDTYLQELIQQASSLNCVQWLCGKCKRDWSKYVEMWDTFCIQLFAYILYEFCVQIVYIVLMMYTFCKSEVMYTKCIQRKCIKNVSHVSTNFCIHFTYKI